MSKAVLMSIKPKWCELIASGKKTVEVRKTAPKLDTPFKVYIYQTKKPVSVSIIGTGKHISEYDKIEWFNERSGMVFGEFVCDKIFPISVYYDNPNSELALKEFPYVCLTDKQIIDYLGNGKQGYGWNISDLKIYDKPKELGEFYKEDFDEVLSNWEDLFSIGVPPGCSVEYPPEPKKEDYIIKRAPQSWCYVEELE